MDQEFGRMLRAAREAAGRTLKEAAEHIGKSIPYLSDVERGHRAPFDNKVISALAAFLQADAQSLLAAAARSRGAFALDAKNVSPQHRVVGAAIARSWSGLSPEQLEQIHEILENAKKENRK